MPPRLVIVLLACALGTGVLGTVPAEPAPTASTAAPTGSARKPLTTVPPHRPTGYQPRVDVGAKDYHGAPVSVSCMTCHATRPADRAMGKDARIPASFHQGLRYAHAEQSCLSCHNPEDYDSLRLADGRSLPYSQAQQLCGQCHGPQTRDFLHGSHGGMNGQWTREPASQRQRNTCTDCHDPHAPAYPHWTPIFAPRDAGARQQAQRDSSPSTSRSHEQHP